MRVLQVIDTFTQFKPEVVGFTTVSSQWSFAVELAGMVKEINPKVIAVTGGVHTTLNPECILETNKMDAVFMGDSEYAFTDFLEKIETPGAGSGVFLLIPNFLKNPSVNVLGKCTGFIPRVVLKWEMYLKSMEYHCRFTMRSTP